MVRPAVRRYTVETAGRAPGVRLVLVTDLHGSSYGPNGQNLLRRIRSLTPDAVMMTGDLFAETKITPDTAHFLKRLGAAFPCFYVTGNHECRSEQALFDREMALIRKAGIIRLSGTVSELKVRGHNLLIGGIDDAGRHPDLYAADRKHQQMQTVREAMNADHRSYRIFLAHRPEAVLSYLDVGADLIFCGHAHGGQWRLPGLINGLYAPGQGLFPKYAGGRYNFDHTVMIVGRGLSIGRPPLPRIFNPPELAAADLI